MVVGIALADADQNADAIRHLRVAHDIDPLDVDALGVLTMVDPQTEHPPRGSDAVQAVYRRKWDAVLARLEGGGGEDPDHLDRLSLAHGMRARVHPLDDLTGALRYARRGVDLYRTAARLRNQDVPQPTGYRPVFQGFELVAILCRLGRDDEAVEELARLVWEMDLYTGDNQPDVLKAVDLFLLAPLTHLVGKTTGATQVRAAGALAHAWGTAAWLLHSQGNLTGCLNSIRKGQEVAAEHRVPERTGVQAMLFTYEAVYHQEAARAAARQEGDRAAQAKAVRAAVADGVRAARNAIRAFHQIPSGAVPPNRYLGYVQYELSRAGVWLDPGRPPLLPSRAVTVAPGNEPVTRLCALARLHTLAYGLSYAAGEPPPTRREHVDHAAAAAKALAELTADAAAQDLAAQVTRIMAAWQ